MNERKEVLTTKCFGSSAPLIKFVEACPYGLPGLSNSPIILTLRSLQTCIYTTMSSMKLNSLNMAIEIVALTVV